MMQWVDQARTFAVRGFNVLKKIQFPSMKFWISWLLVTISGFTIGTIIGGTVFFFSDYFDLASLTIGGLFSGIGQSFVLKRYVNKWWKWGLATFVGFVLCSTVYVLLENEFYISFDHTLNIILIADLIGLIVGALQWVSVSRTLKSFFGWILISALSWSLCVILYYNYSINQFHRLFFVFIPVTGFLLGMVLGAISGAFVESILIIPSSGEMDRQDTGKFPKLWIIILFLLTFTCVFYSLLFFFLRMKLLEFI